MKIYLNYKFILTQTITYYNFRYSRYGFFAVDDDHEFHPCTPHTRIFSERSEVRKFSALNKVKSFIPRASRDDEGLQ